MPAGPKHPKPPITMRSQHVPLAIGALTLVLLIAGCSGPAAVTGTSSDGQTFYRSNLVPLQPDMRNAGLTNVNEIAMRAIASCTGEGCKPESVTLALQNRSGIYMETRFRDIELTVDGRVQEWQDAAIHDPNQTAARAGEFLQFEVSPALFRQIAQGQDVRMRLGSTNYRLVHGRRATFRQMAEEMGLSQRG